MINYKVELKVLSAIHIGAGSNCDISKCDYIKFPNQNKIVVINEKELFSILCDLGFEEQYFKFIENSKGVESNLYNFLVNKCGFTQDKCIDVVNKIKKYELDFHEDKFYGIKTFVKDKLSGKVYIPASTIKGMISTAILAYVTYKNDEISKSKDLTQRIMKEISISDSSLIDLDNLFVSNVFYVSPKNCKSLNQYYEMLKPETIATFVLTVKNGKHEFLESVKRILSDYCMKYEKYYAESFSNSVILTKQEENAIKCYIGAKTGFPTKTFYYQRYQLEAPQKIANILDQSFRKLKGKHINSKGKAPSCMKCVKIKDKIVENGAVQLKFQELKEF